MICRPPARAPLLGIALAGALAAAGCGGAGRGSGQTSARSTPATSDAAPGVGALDSGSTSTAAAILAQRPFAASSPWNTTVSAATVDPRSQSLLALARERLGTTEGGRRVIRPSVVTLNSSIFINTYRWAPPIVVAGGPSTRLVCRQSLANCGDGRRVTSLDIPTGVSPLPQFDGWFTVIDRSRGLGYDLWRARRSCSENVISYQSLRIWNLNGSGYQRPGAFSARGSGLPLFAGVIMPLELRAAAIDHALAISVPGPAQRGYVQPASRTDGSGRPTSLPEGAQIRLRASFRLSGTPRGASRRSALAIVAALKRYGAIVVDRSAVPTLYAQENYDWTGRDRDQNTLVDQAQGFPAIRCNQPASTTTAAAAAARASARTPTLLQGNELQALRLSDFEVVKLPAQLRA